MAKLGACLSVSVRPPSFGPVWFLSVCLCALCFGLSIFLAKVGTQVIVPFRDEDEKRHLKVMGDLGQIVPLVRLVPNLRGSSVCPIGISSLFRGSVGMGREERTTNCRVHTAFGCCV